MRYDKSKDVGDKIKSEDVECDKFFERLLLKRLRAQYL